MQETEKPAAPALQPIVAPPKDKIAAAVEAIARDAKSRPAEYVAATIVPGGGE